MKLLYLLLAVVAGAVQPVQTAMHGRMRGAWGSPILPAFVSLVVGSLALGGVIASGVGGRGDLSRTSSVPWWAWSAGLIGALSVAINVIVLPRLGVAVTIGAAVCGQLVIAALVDHGGWLGMERVPLNAWRVAGIVLLVGGTFLLQRTR